MQMAAARDKWGFKEKRCCNVMFFCFSLVYKLANCLRDSLVLNDKYKLKEHLQL